MKKQPLFTTILLVLVVFTLGVIVGNLWQTSETGQASRTLRQTELDAESFLVEQELFETFETNCVLSEKRINSLSQELWRLGKTIGAENAEKILGSQDYHFLKRKYHLLQARTYVLAKKLQDDCGQQTNIILYYYNQDDPASAQQGAILDQLVNTHNLHVYAIEYGYSRELSFLEEYYELTTAPALVINYKHVLTGVNQPNNIIPLLK